LSHVGVTIEVFWIGSMDLLTQSSLVVSWQRLYKSHCNFKLHMNSSVCSLIPFLPFLLNHLRLPTPQLDQILDN
jgi:hypothetical protein